MIALETGMARAMWDRTVRRNRDLTYNKLTLAELAALAPGGTIGTLLRTAGRGRGGLCAGRSSCRRPLRNSPPRSSRREMLAKLGGGVPATVKLIDEAPLASWQAWLTARFLSDHAAVLPKDIDDANFAFYGTVLSGQPQQRAALEARASAQSRARSANCSARSMPSAISRRPTGGDGAAGRQSAQGDGRQPRRSQLDGRRRPAARPQAKLAAFTPKIGAPATFQDAMTA